MSTKQQQGQRIGGPEVILALISSDKEADRCAGRLFASTLMESLVDFVAAELNIGTPHHVFINQIAMRLAAALGGLTPQLDPHRIPRVTDEELKEGATLLAADFARNYFAGFKGAIAIMKGEGQ